MRVVWQVSSRLKAGWLFLPPLEDDAAKVELLWAVVEKDFRGDAFAAIAFNATRS